jgi:hypothetical protein
VKDRRGHTNDRAAMFFRELASGTGSTGSVDCAERRETHGWVRATPYRISPPPPPLHSPENNHVASVPSHSNTRPAHPKAAIRIPSSAGPTHPIVSVPYVFNHKGHEEHKGF